MYPSSGRKAKRYLWLGLCENQGVRKSVSKSVNLAGISEYQIPLYPNEPFCLTLVRNNPVNSTIFIQITDHRSVMPSAGWSPKDTSINQI